MDALSQKHLLQQQANTAALKISAVTQTLNELATNVTVSLERSDGLGAQPIDLVHEAIRADFEKLLAANPSYPQVLQMQGTISALFSNMYWRAGDLPDAGKAAAQAVQDFQTLLTIQNDNRSAKLNEAFALEKLAVVRREAGDLNGAAAAYQQNLTLRRQVLRSPEEGSVTQPVSAALEARKIAQGSP